MLQNERCQAIYEILQERGQVSSRYLQKRLFSSEATIRRDLEAMERRGMLKRVWGGAVLETSEHDLPSFVRLKTNQDKKEKIAALAAPLLRNAMTIFLDSSTTCLALVPYLAPLKDITVITNSLKMSKTLSDRTNAAIYVLGGQIFEGHILCGYQAVQNVGEFHADTVFFSCTGISAGAGITSIEPRVIEVVRAMMRCSEKKVLLCDTSKIGKTAPLRLAELSVPDAVVMDAFPQEDPALAEALGGRLICAQRDGAAEPPQQP